MKDGKGTNKKIYITHWKSGISGFNGRKWIEAAILRLLKKTPNCLCRKEYGGMYELPAYVHACARIYADL